MLRRYLLLVFAAVFAAHAVAFSWKLFRERPQARHAKSGKIMQVDRVILRPKREIKPKPKKEKKVRKKLDVPARPVISKKPIETILAEPVPEVEYAPIEDVFHELEPLAPALTDEEVGEIRDGYITGIYRAIEQYKRYPRSARRMQQEGVVEVAFTILADGAIGEVRISKASGYSLIDKAALEAVNNIGRLDPIPEALEMERWELILPIRYELH